MEEDDFTPEDFVEIWVHWQQEGWHNWPDAPERRVYLRASHRHMFWYEVRVPVTDLGDDRGIEFHDLLDFCRTATQGPSLGPNSCEMLARALGQEIQGWIEGEGHSHRSVEVTVSEDNECGATVVLL